MEKLSEGCIKEAYSFGKGKKAIVWLHGLNGSWDREGLGKQMSKGMPIPIDDVTVYCVQNPDQKNWSKNEINDIQRLLILKGHTNCNLVGYSQGGMDATGALFKQPSFWNSVGIIAGKSSTTKDYTTIAECEVKVKIWHHERDPIMGESMIKIANLLEKAGVDVEKFIYPGKSHALENVFSLDNPDGYWNWIKRKLSEEPVV